ncbi:MAG TPA: hypothetical protein VH120_14625, partial [Gemmataceae bacterium]|nr:hypothetical protein [Gemmataceae bacterium]
MLARRLTLAAGPSPVADQVQAFMTEAVGRPVGRLGYDECRRRLAWDRPGVLVLVAADETDRESLAGLAREAAVRRSPVSIVAVHPTDCGDVGELADLSVTCLPWPYGSEALADAVRAAPAETARSARDSFADRLAALTPSLVPLAARLA